MKYIITFILFIALFCFFTRKYKNCYKLFFVFGKKGSGKSTYLVKMACKYSKKGFIIYSNMPDLMLPGARYIDTNLIGDFVPEANSCLLIDEVGCIWDSRDFKKFKPSVRDFFKLQRHYHVVCFLASQTFDVDKKLRDLADSMYLVTNLFTIFSLVRPITKKIVLTESTGDSESRIAENLRFELPFSWSITYIPKYAKYFESFIVPDMPKLPYSVNVPLSDPVPRVLHSFFDFNFSSFFTIPKHTHNYIYLSSSIIRFVNSFSIYKLIESTWLCRGIDFLFTALARYLEVDRDDSNEFFLEFSIYITVSFIIIVLLVISFIYLF